MCMSFEIFAVAITAICLRVSMLCTGVNVFTCVLLIVLLVYFCTPGRCDDIAIAKK